MFNLPLKPKGSIIEIENQLNLIVLSWKNPRGGLGRYCQILFLLIWLSIWTFSGVSIFWSMKDPEHIGALIGLAVWLFGELLVIRGLYSLIRPTRPERIVLTLLNLEFEHGTSNNDSLFDGSEGWRKGIASLFKIKKKTRSIYKKDIGEIKLERVGERQRLTFDIGADRIEIGAYLQEPEREWLYEVLNMWKNGKSS
jgi:hypothetical protein